MCGCKGRFNMINEEKIKAMNRLAMYEHGKGKKYLPISRYYRTDYVGQAMIKNLFLITIGYFLILAVLAVYFSEYLMNNIHRMDLRALGIYLVAGYAILMAVYMLITIIIYNVKYYRAKKSVREYYGQLTRLEKMYMREDRKNQSRARTGGHRK